jgi:antirestriction protein ArdC
MTYKQAEAKGWQVKKGSKGTHIIYFKINEYENKKTGDIDKVPMLKRYSVFNGDQIEGFIPCREPVAEVETFDNCDLVEATLEAHEITIKHGGDTAFFSPKMDFIQMPMKQDFISTDEENNQQTYYSTLLHEVTHWTGHKKRLDRDFSGRFGSNAYAFEELVAEIGSVFLCAKMGVKASPSQNNAKYLNNWLEVLKDDKRAIVKAFSLASKASNYIVEKSPVEA